MFDTQFIGREEELVQLNQLITENRYRIITLLGMTGIGKTRLAAQLTKQSKNEFQYVIWKNLRNASSFEDIVNEIIDSFCIKQHINLVTATDKIQYLINSFKENKCLLILDDLTEIVSEVDMSTVYKKGWEQLATFLEQMALQQHESIILISCREFPHNLDKPKIQQNCYQFHLGSLKLEDIKKCFPELYTQLGAEDDWEVFADYYGGNCGALEIAVKWISMNYDGDISQFLEYNAKCGSDKNSLEEIQSLLDKQFKTLSHSEKQVMYLLAIANEPLSIAEIKSLLSSNNISLSRLEYLFLVKKFAYGYTQVAIVMDYVTKRLIREIVEEICHQKTQLINDFPLLNSQAKDHIQDIQKRRLIKPIINQVLETYEAKGKQTLKENLLSMLVSWQETQPKEGYMEGNIINLLSQLDIDLRENMVLLPNAKVGHTF